ncbi:hypothetical protein GQ53DRAFT_838606 [Thozetella sp. PMI_491]|nr:hypothetical protein GQ53DRAFT_838606 [Thozetella sp. PMI_491]
MASSSDSNELGLLRRLRVGMGAVARDGGPGPGPGQGDNGGKGPGPQAQAAGGGGPEGGPGPANTTPTGQGNPNGQGPPGGRGKGKGNRPTANTPAVAGAAAVAPAAAEESQTQAAGPAGPAATPPGPPGPPGGPKGPPQPPGQTTSTTTSATSTSTTTTSSTPSTSSSTTSSTTETSTTAATTAQTVNTSRPTVSPFLASDSTTTSVLAATQATNTTPAITGAATTSDAMTEVFPTGIATVNSDVQMTPGKIAGITIGTVAAFFFAILAIHFLFRWRKNRLPEFDMVKARSNNRASSRWRWTQMSRSSRPYDEMDDPLVDPEAGEVPPLPPSFAREVARTNSEWDNSKTSFRLPPINLERPVAALRKSIAQFKNLGPFGLNTVHEEDEKSSTKRSSGANTHKRGTVRSITSMFFSRQFFGNRGSTATNRTSQMSTGSGYGEGGLFNRQSILSTPESDLVSPRASMDPSRDGFPLATPLSYPTAAYISPTSTLKPRLGEMKKGETQFTSLQPLAEPRNTFPGPPPSPSGSAFSSQSSVASIPVDAVSPESESSSWFGHRSV